jgi:hypothetical protein
MTLSKEQAEAAFEAITVSARQERAKQAAVRDLKRRKIMPVRWTLCALLAGVGIGFILFWFVFSQRPIWAVAVCMCLSIGFAQIRWNQRVETQHSSESAYGGPLNR